MNEVQYQVLKCCRNCGCLKVVVDIKYIDTEKERYIEISPDDFKCSIKNEYVNVTDVCNKYI